MTDSTPDKTTSSSLNAARLSSKFSPQKKVPEAGVEPVAKSALNPEAESEMVLEGRVRISFEKLGYPQLNAIECVADGDQVRLTGVLSSYYLKQVAQSVVVKIPGVSQVHNEIEVR